MIPVAVLVGLLAFLLVRLRDARLAGAPDVGVGDAAPWTPARARPSGSRARAIGVLALAETRRLVVHPVMLVGAALSTLLVGLSTSGDEPFARYVELTGGGGSSLYAPVLAFGAAAACASRTRRTRSAEVFDATAASAFDRTLAQCLAALGPALISLAVILAAWGAFVVTGRSLPGTPPVWELLTLPLAMLGAGTLAVMVSRWLPFRGAPLIVVVGLVFLSAWLAEQAPLLITFVEWPEWLEDDTYVLTSLPSGAHALYILGLDVMAVIGALLYHPGHRRPLLALGAVATLVTVAAALAAT